MIDKNYCMSSYLAFRYIEKQEAEFSADMHHALFESAPSEKTVAVSSADEIDFEIQKVFDYLHNEKLGILLSGGMDSACLAAYMPNTDAYTFRFMGGDYQKDELVRAEYYAEQYKLNLHYVEIDWDTIESVVDIVMKRKCAPVHSIEPQIYLAAKQAQADGCTMLVVGESADLWFGGMDKLLAEDWTLEDFAKRYIFMNPKLALREPVDIMYLFDRYRKDGDMIDFQAFMETVFSTESSSSYMNAFDAAGIPYIDPYAHLRMAKPLDLHRVRTGDSKYLIRDLFRMKYPKMEVPDKIPMPRPVDAYFADWEGPKRKEFLQNIDMKALSGNQKWQLWCLERFLNRLDEGKMN